jgi:nucleoside-diphosphate-sugar epimerase
MRVLVTGATGRVGSRLVPRLLERGDSIRVLLRKEADREPFAQRGAEVVLGDLSDAESLGKAVAGVEAVVHVAAFFRGATEAEARATNLDGTLALAQAARPNGVSKFIYISTNLVYGPGRGRPTRETDEARPPADHFYPVSKLAAERALVQFYQGRETDLSILRLAFVYGDGDPHLREAINLTRSWPPAKRMHIVHHADVAQAILLSLEKPRSGGQLYNVADDTPVPISEVREMHGLAEMNVPADVEVADPWEGIVNTAKIKDELGFRPIYPSLRDAENMKAL